MKHEITKELIYCPVTGIRKKYFFPKPIPGGLGMPIFIVGGPPVETTAPEGGCYL